MALTITYWTNFSKRINSTKQPTGGTNITTVALKTPCSIDTPVFVFNGVSDSINYIKWGSRYYYVTEVTWLTNDNIQVSCDLDVLATYKSNILATKAFVEYSTSDYNSSILDTRISTTSQVVHQYASDLSISSAVSAQGTYILSVVGSDGAARRYALSASDLVTLGGKISTALDTDITDAFVRKWGNLSSCILGCTWVPFNYGTGTDTIYLGSYNTTVQGKAINLLAQTIPLGTISIPWNNTESCRRDNENVTIFLPGYGTTELTPAAIDYANSISVELYHDINGGIIYTITAGDQQNYYQANVGVDIPITHYTQSPIGMLIQKSGNFLSQWAASMVSGGNLATQGAVAEGIGGYVADIVGRIGQAKADIGSSGGQGGAVLGYSMTVLSYIRVVCRSYTYSETQANMADRYGRPLYAVRTLSSLTGFVKTNGASVDIPGFEEEKNKVCALLNGGIFIE